MDVLKEHSPALKDLQETTKGTYSRYDCYVPEKNLYVELKHRGNDKHWDDTMIEKAKYDYLTGLYGISVYAVYSCGNLYVFNLTRLTKENYDFDWQDKHCNKTTAFKGQSMNGVKVNKKVGGINWDAADKIIKVKL